MKTLPLGREPTLDRILELVAQGDRLSALQLVKYRETPQDNLRMESDEIRLLREKNTSLREEIKRKYKINCELEAQTYRLEAKITRLERKVSQLREQTAGAPDSQRKPKKKPSR